MKIALSSIVLVAGSLAVGCVVDSTPPQSPPPADPAAPPPPPAVAVAPPAAAPVAAPAAAPIAAPAAAPAAVPAQPAYEPPPRPAVAPVRLPISDAAGTPRGLRPGDTMAYWIWYDGRGGEEWHVRMTTAADLHRFAGRIWAEGGGIADVHPSQLELNDRVRRVSGTEVEFDVSTQGGMDGFDMRLAGGTCVVVHLLIDKKAEPSRVNIGAQGVHPGGQVFSLCR